MPDLQTTASYYENKPHLARSKIEAMKRGFLGRCPACGSGRLFGRFLKVVDHCPECNEDYTHQRVDDLPAYLVVLVVGHIVVGGFMMTDLVWIVPGWLHLAIWVPITLLLSLALLQPTKGAIVGLQWAARMHGFGGDHPKPEGTP